MLHFDKLKTVQTPKTLPQYEQDDIKVKLDILYGIDFSQLKKRLAMQAPAGAGWSPSQIAISELWYRRFLHVKLIYPNETIVPNHPIDEFWHFHILDTAAYRKDCDSVFGYFLDHYPYFGQQGDLAERDACFYKTNLLFRGLFGEGLEAMFGTSVRAGLNAQISMCGDGDGPGPHIQDVFKGSSCGANDTDPTIKN